MSVTTPHLRVPFDMNIAGTHAEIVEQDSVEDVAQCVEMLLRTPYGTRLDDPDYGVPDLTFTDTGDREEFLRYISEWEPRASTTLTEEEIEEIERRITVGVDTRED